MSAELNKDFLNTNIQHNSVQPSRKNTHMRITKPIDGVTQSHGKPRGIVTEPHNLRDYLPKTTRELAFPSIEFKNALADFKIGVKSSVDSYTEKTGWNPGGVNLGLKQSHGKDKGQLSFSAKTKLLDLLTVSLDFKTPDLAKIIESSKNKNSNSHLPVLAIGGEVAIPKSKEANKFFRLFGIVGLLETYFGAGEIGDATVKISFLTDKYPIEVSFNLPYKGPNYSRKVTISIAFLPSKVFFKRLYDVGKLAGNAAFIKAIVSFVSRFATKCPSFLKTIFSLSPRLLSRLNLPLSLALTGIDLVHLGFVVKDLVKIQEVERDRGRKTAKDMKEHIKIIRKKLYALEYANYVFGGELRTECRSYRTKYNKVCSFALEASDRRGVPEDYDPAVKTTRHAVQTAKDDIITKANLNRDLFDLYVEMHSAMVERKRHNANKGVPLTKDLAKHNAAMDILRLFFVDILFLHNDVKSGQELFDQMFRGRG